MRGPRFRIIEDRQVVTGDGWVSAAPVYYIEERENFLFFSVWNRFLSGYSTKEKAMEMVKALNESREFKPKVLQ